MVFLRADVAQLVEHSLGKGEVTGSIPVISSRLAVQDSGGFAAGGSTRALKYRVNAGVTQW
jgi:hypothetical protein